MSFVTQTALQPCTVSCAVAAGLQGEDAILFVSVCCAVYKVMIVTGFCWTSNILQSESVFLFLFIICALLHSVV